MQIITSLLYTLSNSLLLPVILLLISAFALALALLGGFYATAMQRKRSRRNRENAIANWEKDPRFEIQPGAARTPFWAHVDSCLKAAGDSAALRKITGDFEIVLEKSLALPKLLLRIGPMLGLMGTLIPMGPALMGLAQGDIASMAVNMQVAFATTVVGLFVGAVGYILQLFRQRWAAEDMIDLEYIADRVAEASAASGNHRPKAVSSEEIHEKN